MYVVLEGIDTCGKSTQIELLKKEFPNAIFTKEPGGSELGIKLREIILNENQKNNFTLSKKAEFFLFLADRAQHLESILKKHKNDLIISDRSLISGIAYAEFSKAESINRFCMEDFLPDLCFVFKIDSRALKNRLESKNNDSIESRGIEFMLKVQDKLLSTSRKIAKTCIEINANDSKENILNTIKQEIKARL